MDRGGLEFRKKLKKLSELCQPQISREAKKPTSRRQDDIVAMIMNQTKLITRKWKMCILGFCTILCVLLA